MNKNAVVMALLVVGACSVPTEPPVEITNTARCTGEDEGNCPIDPCADYPPGCCPGSPILFDLAGDGFQLTNVSHGVEFSLKPGTLAQWSWTAPDGDDAWLALDRNGNGTIDDGSELFGDQTPQIGSTRDGFHALAELDDNHDGSITPSDTVWAKLRLWRDFDHDGRSTPDELLTLDSKGIHAIGVTATKSEYKDPNGNEFRLKGNVVANAPVTSTISDVWLQPGAESSPADVCSTVWHCSAWSYAIANHLDPSMGINPPCSIPGVAGDRLSSFAGRTFRYVVRYGSGDSYAGAAELASNGLISTMLGVGNEYCLFGEIPNPDPNRTSLDVPSEIVNHSPIGMIPAFSYQRACRSTTLCTPGGGGGCGLTGGSL